MNKQNLQNHNSTNGMFDDIANILDYQNIDIEDITDEHDLYKALDYSGSVHECIDGMIDVYYYELRKWAVDNLEYVDQAIDECLTDSKNDYHQLIQLGQYVYYREMAQEAVEELFNVINA